MKQVKTKSLFYERVLDISSREEYFMSKELIESLAVGKPIPVGGLPSFDPSKLKRGMSFTENLLVLSIALFDNFKPYRKKLSELWDFSDTRRRRYDDVGVLFEALEGKEESRRKKVEMFNPIKMLGVISFDKFRKLAITPKMGCIYTVIGTIEKLSNRYGDIMVIFRIQGIFEFKG